MFVPRGCSVPSKHRAGGRSNRHSIRAPLCRLTMVPMRAVLRSNVDRPPHIVSGVGWRRRRLFLLAQDVGNKSAALGAGCS
jgi:hypothetical protein